MMIQMMIVLMELKVGLFEVFKNGIKDKERYEHVLNTLEYNGIILHKSTIRDGKINKILENELEK